MNDLHAIVIKDKESGISSIYHYTNGVSKRKLICCSRDPNQLKGYVKMFLKPFDKEEKDYEIVNIQSLVNDRFISRRNLSEVTDDSLYRMLANEVALAH